MASLTYITLDVFTSKKYTGNQLALVHLPSSTPLTQEQKQTIAREFDYSETVFLHQPPTTTSSSGDGIPEWRVDIFTVQEEIPFAGHPTIGTAVHCLRALQQPSADGNQEAVKGRFRVKAGVLEIEYSNGVARAKIPHAFHLHTAHTLRLPQILSQQPKLAAFLGGEAGDDVDLQVVSPVRGMSFGMLALPSLEALGAVGTTGARVAAELDEGWDVGPLMMMFFVRLQSADAGVVRLRTRMIEGSFEDPATGSASVALGAMIAVREKREGRTRFELVQAVEMGRRSEIGVEIVVERGVIKTAELIGGAVEVMEGKLFYE